MVLEDTADARLAIAGAEAGAQFRTAGESRKTWSSPSSWNVCHFAFPPAFGSIMSGDAIPSAFDTSEVLPQANICQWQQVDPWTGKPSVVLRRNAASAE
jgi:hypothetical protein